MKRAARILNRKPIDYLFDHILDGFKASTEGLKFVRNEVKMSDAEYIEWLEKNADRLIERIHEFKVTHKIMSIGFAFLFTWMQVSGDELEMRRPVRNGRATRSTRRRNDDNTFFNT